MSAPPEGRGGAEKEVLKNVRETEREKEENQMGDERERKKENEVINF